MSKVLEYIQANVWKSIIAAALIVVLIVTLSAVWSDGGKAAQAAEKLEHQIEIELMEKVSKEKTELIRAQRDLADFHEKQLQKHRDK